MFLSQHKVVSETRRSVTLNRSNKSRKDTNMKRLVREYRLLTLVVLLQVCAIAAHGQNIRMSVDATDAPHNILHTRLIIPVNPGPLSLFYPKWVRGEHSPTGPLNDMTSLHLTADGKPIPWTRAQVEVFAFHCVAPPGVHEFEVAFDDVSQPGTTMSARLARVKWNRVLVYPRGVNGDAIHVETTIKLPNGWKFATALPVARE